MTKNKNRISFIDWIASLTLAMTVLLEQNPSSLRLLVPRDDGEAIQKKISILQDILIDANY